MKLPLILFTPNTDTNSNITLGGGQDWPPATKPQKNLDDKYGAEIWGNNKQKYLITHQPAPAHTHTQLSSGVVRVVLNTFITSSDRRKRVYVFNIYLY